MIIPTESAIWEHKHHTVIVKCNSICEICLVHTFYKTFNLICLKRRGGGEPHGGRPLDPYKLNTTMHA